MPCSFGREPNVRDYLPLQQGLRRAGEHFFELLTCGVRDYLPLQQGLRQVFIFVIPIIHPSSETIFHYNKD